MLLECSGAALKCLTAEVQAALPDQQAQVRVQRIMCRSRKLDAFAV
jgi:hypothetical protein